MQITLEQAIAMLRECNIDVQGNSIKLETDSPIPIWPSYLPVEFLIETSSPKQFNQPCVWAQYT